MSKLKILYTIFTTSHGNGGHFYSLSTTAKAVSSRANVEIVNIGLSNSPVISSSGLSFQNIIINGSGVKSGFISVYKEFQKVVNEVKPDIIHSFCTLSFLFARTYAIKHPIKTFLTKCGGPNPKTYFPYTYELILYSKENMEYFSARKKFITTNIQLIPNRVATLGNDTDRITELKELLNLDPNSIVFLRIGRISFHYESILLQSIMLIKDLRARNIDAKLLLIGNIQNESVLEKLIKNSDHNTLIVNDFRFTKEAARLIDIADFVIGTGRSLMEAASKGKILLAPNREIKYPMLVNKDNLDHFLYYNFSPRNSIIENDEKVFSQILDIIKTNQLRIEASRFAFGLFNDFFDIGMKLDEYIHLYQNVKSKKHRLRIDVLVHIAFYLRYLGKINDV